MDDIELYLEAPDSKSTIVVRCLICYGRLPTNSLRGSWNIFLPTLLTTASRIQIHTKLSEILCMELVEDTCAFPSHVICKKCYKLLNDVDTVEASLESMKEDMRSKFKDSLNNLKKESGSSLYSAVVPSPESESEVPPPVLKPKGKPIRRKTKANDDEDFKPKEDKPSRKSRCQMSIDVDVEIKEDENTENIEITTIQPLDEGASEDGRFECTLCNKRFLFSSTATTHIANQHIDVIYFCDICSMQFKVKSEMNSHLDYHDSNGEAPFQCYVCKKEYQFAQKLRDHMKVHSSKVHSCSECKKYFTTVKQLSEHMNSHTGARPYSCTKCSKTFTYHTSLRNHSKLHSTRPRSYSCKDCQKDFLTPHSLQVHRRIHTGLKNFTCETCNKSFSSSYNLTSHQVVHTGERPFVCKYCGKGFGRKELLRDHNRIHTGERPFQCEICGATFSKRANFIFHKEASHYNIRRHKCIECNKAFTRKRLLDYHNNAVHTGEKPYKCHICSAAFVYPHHHKKHLKIHSGDKPFKCELCGKPFNSKENRNAHRFIHSEKKPYECRICGQGFMRKPALYHHMQVQNHLEDIIIVNQLQIPNSDTPMEDGQIFIQVNESSLGDDSMAPSLGIEEAEESRIGSMEDIIMVDQLQFSDGQLDDNSQSIQYILADNGGSVQDLSAYVEEGNVEVVYVQT